MHVLHSLPALLRLVLWVDALMSIWPLAVSSFHKVMSTQYQMVPLEFPLVFHAFRSPCMLLVPSWVVDLLITSCLLPTFRVLFHVHKHPLRLIISCLVTRPIHLLEPSQVLVHQAAPSSLPSPRTVGTCPSCLIAMDAREIRMSSLRTGALTCSMDFFNQEG